ncbi:MAG: FMN-binding protein [Gemmatimonadota bacterium]|nr:FMN-binding protein [Gemmatimonadota bacterium]
MREIIKLGGVLTLITMCAAGALANVYLLTRDRIAYVEAAREEAARKAALPDAVLFKADSTKDGFRFFRAYNDSSANAGVSGFVAMALGKGYSSNIRTFVGVDLKMKITGIKVAFQQETPGLGTRIEEVKRGEESPWFQDQFKGKTVEYLEVVRGKDPERIEAITGATISSEAVAGSVREAVIKLQRVAK